MGNRFIIGLMILSGSYISCKHKCTDPSNVDCSNYNTCLKEHPVSADFAVEEDQFTPSSKSVWKYYTSDTVVADGYIRFTAKEDKCISYEWHIGAGVYTEKQFQLLFPANVAGKAIPITLIVHKTPNLKCFPTDDGYDTITKSIHFVTHCQSLINGKFFGHNEDKPSDTFTVTVNNCHPGWEELYINNLVPGFEIDTNFGSLCTGEDLLFGYKELHFNTSGSCLPGGHISCKLEQDNNTMKIEFNYLDTISSNIIYKTFIGKKL